MLYANFYQLNLLVLEKIFLYLLFLVMVAILDPQPDPILQFCNPGVSSRFMWNLTTIGAVVLEKKLFEVV